MKYSFDELNEMYANACYDCNEVEAKRIEKLMQELHEEETNQIWEMTS